MSELRELYQTVILDHNKKPRNFGAIEGADRTADGFNPLCGDKITVYLKVDGAVIRDVSFQGSGCAISTASATLRAPRSSRERSSIFETTRPSRSAS